MSLSLHAKGSHGEAYIGVPEGMEKHVIVKAAFPHGSHLLENEAKVLRALGSHPNICPLLSEGRFRTLKDRVAAYLTSFSQIFQRIMAYLHCCNRILATSTVRKLAASYTFMLQSMSLRFIPRGCGLGFFHSTMFSWATVPHVPHVLTV